MTTRRNIGISNEAKTKLLRIVNFKQNLNRYREVIVVEVLNVVCDFRHLNIYNTTTTIKGKKQLAINIMSTVNTCKKGYNDND